MTSAKDDLEHAVKRARAFLAGEKLAFAEADACWRTLKKGSRPSLARAVLARMRSDDTLLDGLPADRKVHDTLCQQEALLTSKDPELSTATRHDRALALLDKHFVLDDPVNDGDGETLGIAGGIYKRRWGDLGRLDDLVRAARLYERGATGPFGDDAYAHINCAFLEDLLAAAGQEPEKRRQRATAIRERIVSGLPRSGSWWNAATRAEALFGLGRYTEALEELEAVRKTLATAATPDQKPALWNLESTARQLATLAHLRHERPLDVQEVRDFFEVLFPDATEAVRSVMVGKVGLALSGGGFRASFYHLGVLARLAELDVLRHVEVLSCVSGGSIVGACYWLALRRRLLDRTRMNHDDYVSLVQELIAHFESAVATDLRGAVQPSKLKAVWRMLTGSKGAMDSELTAGALEDEFYRKLLPGAGPLYMHDLPFQPTDHDSALTGSPTFNPTHHNWLRTNKVPVLVLNATTVNTGHAWQFTPTWMGESPWAVHEAANSVPRLEWSTYAPEAGWQITLGRAVAASACVPFVFEPLRIDGAYEDAAIEVQLVDGGVHDNQGIVSLLISSCNVVLVSDAAGQLLLEKAPDPGLMGLGKYAKRSMDVLMERIRHAHYADLSARRQSGLLRGLMFLHMKAGLDADPIRLARSTEAYELRRAPLTDSGVRKDFQKALAELRTDLDAFTPNEANALMACGYQMAAKAFQRDLASARELWEEPTRARWSFDAMLREITSTEANTPARDGLLAELRAGSSVRL